MNNIHHTILFSDYGAGLCNQLLTMMLDIYYNKQFKNVFVVSNLLEALHGYKTLPISKIFNLEKTNDNFKKYNVLIVDNGTPEFKINSITYGTAEAKIDITKSVMNKFYMEKMLIFYGQKFNQFGYDPAPEHHKQMIINYQVNDFHYQSVQNQDTPYVGISGNNHLNVKLDRVYYGAMDVTEIFKLNFVNNTIISVPDTVNLNHLFNYSITEGENITMFFTVNNVPIIYNHNVISGRTSINYNFNNYNGTVHYHFNSFVTCPVLQDFAKSLEFNDDLINIAKSIIDKNNVKLTDTINIIHIRNETIMVEYHARAINKDYQDALNLINSVYCKYITEKINKTDKNIVLTGRYENNEVINFMKENGYNIIMNDQKIPDENNQVNAIIDLILSGYGNNLFITSTKINNGIVEGSTFGMLASLRNKNSMEMVTILNDIL